METQTKYLYGAAVQGIQSFIFQTNELKDIIGASELVEMICTDFFKEFVGEGELVVSAAGNIKCIFNKESECRRAVLEFPKKVMEAAPGITISEAVVAMKEGDSFGDAVEELEARLRTQRNKPFPSITTGLMSMERSRKTGLPAVRVNKKGEYLDAGTDNKRKNNKTLGEQSTTHKLFNKCFGQKQLSKESMALYLEKLTSENNWIAIIHADGNGLGEIVSRIGKDEHLLSQFSKKLDEVTTLCAQKTYETFNIGPEEIIPFRPVVLGGDDLTIICRGSLALDYATKFIKNFEEGTADMIQELRKNGAKLPDGLKKLTACAGISYIKSSYPFYYGYDLAEALCDRAKKDAKRKGASDVPSCIMFHKVQSSFVEDFNDICNKELIIRGKADKTSGNAQVIHSFENGPYYLYEEEGRCSVEKLQKTEELLQGKEGNAIKSDIRQWMTLMYESFEKAEQKTIRVKSLTSGRLCQVYDDAVQGKAREDGIIRHMAYDLLSLHSINMEMD